MSSGRFKIIQLEISNAVLHTQKKVVRFAGNGHSQDIDLMTRVKTPGNDLEPSTVN